MRTGGGGRCCCASCWHRMGKRGNGSRSLCENNHWIINHSLEHVFTTPFVGRKEGPLTSSTNACTQKRGAIFSSAASFKRKNVDQTPQNKNKVMVCVSEHATHKLQETCCWFKNFHHATYFNSNLVKRKLQPCAHALESKPKGSPSMRLIEVTLPGSHLGWDTQLGLPTPSMPPPPTPQNRKLGWPWVSTTEFHHFCINLP